jgi:hypothetical protein
MNIGAANAVKYCELLRERQLVKDDCYVLGTANGTEMQVMIRNGELWLDVQKLSPNQRAQMLLSKQELAFEPEDEITYVRAYYFGSIWPEMQAIINDLARKLKLKLPWPEN